MITKDRLIEHFRDNFDSTIESIIKDLKLKEEEMPKLKELLEELMKEKIIGRGMTSRGYEYDWNFMEGNPLEYYTN